MRVLFPRLAPAGVMVAVAAAAAALFAMSPSSRAAIATLGCPASGPCPTPTSAFITIDPTAGGATTQVNVHGRQFLNGQAINLYWDVPSHVAGSTSADGNGSFDLSLKPFPGDQPGKHLLYVSEPPNPHATFTLEGPPTPTPSASPVASDSPTPSASATPAPTDSPSPTPSPLAVASINGIDVITRPPFVFLPIIALLALVGLVAYWALGGAERSRPAALPAASVLHRSARPDYLKTLERPAASPAAPTIAEPLPPVAPLPVTEPEAPTPPPPPAEPPISQPPPEPPPAEPTPDWPATHLMSPAEEPPPPHNLPAASDAPPDLPEPGD